MWKKSPGDSNQYKAKVAVLASTPITISLSGSEGDITLLNASIVLETVCCPLKYRFNDWEVWQLQMYDYLWHLEEEAKPHT